MILNKNNIENEINSISLHDDIIEEFKFDIYQRRISLTLLSYKEERKEYTLEYIDVLGFEINSDRCWCVNSPNIVDFEYVNDKYSLLLSRLIEDVNNRTCEDFRKKNLEKTKDCFETLITFATGDRLRVVCDSIQIENIKF